MNYDVVVSGAGPAGSRCAEILARNGFNVALIEYAPLLITVILKFWVKKGSKTSSNLTGLRPIAETEGIIISINTKNPHHPFMKERRELVYLNLCAEH